MRRLGGTYYHKFNDYWHIAFETWNIHEFRVPNLDNPVAAAAIAGGGTPFIPQIMPFNAPNAAHCGNATSLTCTADEQAFLLYVNYSPNKLNNFTLRTEFFMDPQGQRTGVVTNKSMQRWDGNIGSPRKSKFARKSPTIAR
jgi:hypothetical protein